MSAIANTPPTTSPDGEAERHQIEFEKTAALFFLVGDIDSGDQSAHAARGAPKRQQKTDDSGKTKRTVRAFHQAVQFLAQKLLGLRRQNPVQRRDLLFDLSSVENKPI
jgi:hypothetical protein